MDNNGSRFIVIYFQDTVAGDTLTQSILHGPCDDETTTSALYLLDTASSAKRKADVNHTKIVDP